MNRGIKAWLAIAIAISGVALADSSDLVSSHETEVLQHSFDFEDGTLAGLNISGNEPEVTREVSRIGERAMRSYVDRINSSNSYRTEVRIPGSQSIGKEYWVGISIYLPDDYRLSDRYEILFQMHDSPVGGHSGPSGGRNPVFALVVGERGGSMAGHWGVVGRWSPIYAGTKDDQKSAFRESIGAIEPGRWTDFVFHWKWAYDHGQGGFTNVWKNGELVFTYEGPNTFNDDNGPYVKFGIYKGWKNRDVIDEVSTRLVYHDEFRQAGADGSYALVAPDHASRPDAPPHAPPVLLVE